jgi:plastocyanin
MAELARVVLSAAGGVRGRPPIVAVDGRSSSGKTTLARRLQAELPGAMTVHTATDTTIAQGASVTFTTPAGAGPPHNVNFPDEPKPTCKLSTSDAGSPPPMPAAVARGWTGTCAFDQPGAYRFICDRHPAMTGTITVAASATPTATPVANVPAPLPTPAGGAAPSPTGAIGAAPASPRAAIWVNVDHHQSGARVHGSLVVTTPAARLEITLFSRRVALGMAGRRRVPVGRSLTSDVPAGARSFSIGLSARARRALRTRGRLSVLVQVQATAPGATPVTRLQAVRLTPAMPASGPNRGLGSW